MSARIVARGLGKRYHIDHGGASYRTLREDVMQAMRGGRVAGTTREEVWALRDVSFDVADGEVLGIIGRNGAGKSTLLKILARIVHPTTGHASVRGRVGTLLEVGTGFHPELTGRDNVFLSGAILGMTRAETRRRFDEIVDFSGVERFLDTPVKRYSSGMHLRLAFAVAAHLEADILIVDEVLAVGDAEFQQKCLGRMQEVAGRGRTVLFVSHNLAAVRSLCHRAIVLEGGAIAVQGDVHDCIAQYLHASADPMAATIQFEPGSYGGPRMRRATVLSDGQPATRLMMGSKLSVEIEFESDLPLRVPMVAYAVVGEAGDAILTGGNLYQGSSPYELPVDKGTIRMDLGVVPLMAGRYAVSLWLGDVPGRDSHVAEHALSFEVVEQDIWGSGQVPEAHISFLWWPTKFQFGPPGGGASPGGPAGRALEEPD